MSSTHCLIWATHGDWSLPILRLHNAMGKFGSQAIGRGARTCGRALDWLQTLATALGVLMVAGPRASGLGCDSIRSRSASLLFPALTLIGCGLFGSRPALLVFVLPAIGVAIGTCCFARRMGFCRYADLSPKR